MGQRTFFFRTIYRVFEGPKAEGKQYKTIDAESTYFRNYLREAGRFDQGQADGFQRMYSG